jgi:hypothetical protein
MEKGDLGTETLPRPPQIQRWAQIFLITKQSRGCNCTLNLSSDLDLILQAKDDKSTRCELWCLNPNVGGSKCTRDDG